MELYGNAPKIDLLNHPLYKNLIGEHGFEVCDKDNIQKFVDQPGLTMVLFIEDPNRMKETMDALVIAPELAKVCRLIQRKAVVGPPNARKVAILYGFKRWPALVFLRDGKYLGAVDGLRIWSELIQETDRIINSEPTYPPSIGIPIKAV